MINDNKLVITHFIDPIMLIITVVYDYLIT